MRKITNRRLEVLSDVWLFNRCSRRELAALESVATALSVPAGRTLVRKGEFGREFVVIMSGRAEVVLEGTRLAVLGPGSFFGEMSLLDRKPRTASVTTLEPTDILVLTTAEFNKVTTTMPSVDRKLMTVLVERLRDVEAKFVPAADQVSDLFHFSAPAHSSASRR